MVLIKSGREKVKPAVLIDNNSPEVTPIMNDWQLCRFQFHKDSSILLYILIFPQNELQK